MKKLFVRSPILTSSLLAPILTLIILVAACRTQTVNTTTWNPKQLLGRWYVTIDVIPNTSDFEVNEVVELWGWEGSPQTSDPTPTQLLQQKTIPSPAKQLAT